MDINTAPQSRKLLLHKYLGSVYVSVANKVCFDAQFSLLHRTQFYPGLNMYDFQLDTGD